MTGNLGAPAYPEYLRRIARLIVDARFSSLPKDVVDQAKRIVLDDLAAIVAGGEDATVRSLLAAIKPSQAEARVLAPPWPRVSIADAVLLNGIAGTTLELDGGYRPAPAHAGIYCLPVVLALGEVGNISGREILVALVLGYELAARLAEGTRLDRLMHPHGLWAVPAAAVSASKIQNLDSEMVLSAVAVASALTVNTSYRCAFEGASVRNAWAGWSGVAGLTAVRLAQAGMTGLADPFAETFGRLLGSFDSSRMAADWGSPYAVLRHYHKRYACEGHAHVALDVVEALRLAHQFSAEDVVGIDVETYATASRRSVRAPSTPLAARYSIPFAIATLLVNGNASPQSFAPAALADPRVRRLARRITVREDPALTGDERVRRPARVRLRLSDGRRIEGMGENPPGDYRQPTPTVELVLKFEQLVGPIVGANIAASVARRVLMLDEEPDVSDLLAELASGGRGRALSYEA